MFGALSERSLCLQQTDRNSSPLKLHVWKFHRDENANYWDIEESASHCHKAAGPTESAQSCKSSSVGAQAHVTKQPGKEEQTDEC